jgi:hypothetical protein
VQKYEKIWEVSLATANFSLFTFHFSLFLVSLQHETETNHTNHLAAIAFNDDKSAGLAVC